MGKDLAQSISNLWDWLSTWKDDSNGVHGYVVHHHRDNLKVTAPDPWAQAPCVLGCLELYKKSHDEYWLALASGMGQYLVKHYVEPAHVYLNSNHEHKPLGTPSVISNALPSLALLKLAMLRNKTGLDREEFLSTAEDNIEKYLLREWNPSIGAIVSKEQGSEHFVLNMNGISAMALLSLASAKNDMSLVENYVKPICNFIIRFQIHEGKLAGSYPYLANSTNTVSLYTLITAYSLLQVYEELKEEKYLQSAQLAIEHLDQFYNAELGLLPHYHEASPPYWLPDTALFILIHRKLESLGHTQKINVDLSKFLTRQYPHGGYPLSVGFRDHFDKNLLPSRPSIKRWRDILPTPNWNAWIFWHLCEMLESETALPKPASVFPFNLRSDKEETEGPYSIVEGRSTTTFEDDQMRLVALFNKQSDVAQLCTISERSESYRLSKMLDRYPKLVRKMIFRASSFFGNPRKSN